LAPSSWQKIFDTYNEKFFRSHDFFVDIFSKVTISFYGKDSLGLNYKLLCFHAYAAQLCELCRDFVEETCEQLRPVIFSGTSSGERASLCNTF
jgi:hypothetical protein